MILFCLCLFFSYFVSLKLPAIYAYSFALGQQRLDHAFRSSETLEMHLFLSFVQALVLQFLNFVPSRKQPEALLLSFGRRLRLDWTDTIVLQDFILSFELLLHQLDLLRQIILLPLELHQPLLLNSTVQIGLSY